MTIVRVRENQSETEIMLHGDHQSSKFVCSHLKVELIRMNLALRSSSERHLGASIADVLYPSFKIENLIKGLPPASIEATFSPSRRYLHRIGHLPPFLHGWIGSHVLHIPVPVVADVFERRKERRYLVIEEN